MNKHVYKEKIFEVCGIEKLMQAGNSKKYFKIGGVDAIDLGTEAILYMRQFMQHKKMPEELVQKITAEQ